MAERNEALDRLLAAISPTLSAELDRMTQQTQETLEKDFQNRVDAAVREAEANMKRANEAARERTIAEARDTARHQITQELESRFRQAHEDATKELRKSHEENLNRMKSEANAERTRLQEQLHRWRIFAEAQQQLSEASSQAEILTRFMKLAEAFCAGVAVYVTKADGLALWKKRGQSAFPEIISGDTTDPEFCFKPITVRGKTVAAVYAEPPLNTEALQFLVGAVEQAIEVFGLKLRRPPKSPAMTERTVAATAAADSAPAMGAIPATGDDDDQRLHAEARRTARLLIAEIKLYHEQELQEGRENCDIYQRLQKEIDHGRVLYSQQVSGDILAARDYFHDELVRILTENEPSRLGEAYPGPKKV
jgi:hypothetical protein